MKVSRKIFSNIFFSYWTSFKSRKIIEKNLKIFSVKVSNVDKKKKLLMKCGKIMEKLSSNIYI